MVRLFGFGIILSTLGLIGCGSGKSHESSKVVATDDIHFYGAKVAAAEADLPTCDTTRLGQLFYVLESSEFQFCTKSGYEVIDLAGEDGVPGADGEEGPAGSKGSTGSTGADGSSCSVKSNANGTKTVTCTDNTSAILENGQGCSIEENLDGTYILTCGDVSVLVKNGEDGGMGKPGTDGLSFLSGKTLPLESLGKDGDTYLDVTESVYYQKVKGMWSILYGSATWSSNCETVGNCGVFSDSRESRFYRWTKIGTGDAAQIWMAENLKFPVLEHSWCKDPDTENALDINTDYCDTYGRSYDWEGASSACPTGWHLPTDAEWMVLEESVGLPKTVLNTFGSRGDVEGNMLKDLSSLWGNSFGTNESGFSALPAGYVDQLVYSGISKFGTFWTSTVETVAGNAIAHGVNGADGAIERNSYLKTYGISVRCVKTGTP